MIRHSHPTVAVVREGFEALQRGDTGWMDQHLADDVVWHVGGNSKWAGAYQGKEKVLEYFARQPSRPTGHRRWTSTTSWATTSTWWCWERPRPGRRTGPAPSGSTPRSSISGMGRRPRSGEWPRTTPRSTRSWTASPVERWRRATRPTIHRAVAPRGAWRS